MHLVSTCLRLLPLLLIIGCSARTTGREKIENPESTENGSEYAGEETMVKEQKSGSWSPELSDDEKQTLFSIAMDTLDWCVNGGQGAFSFHKYTLTPRLKVPTATFVTLQIRETLRGCIGSLEPQDEMYQSVHRNAILAALRDTRFRPVTPKELPEINVHVSILSPIRAIESHNDFTIGEQGIILSKKGRRSVFLPEVAPEQGWNKEETLTHLSMKAGLDADAWKEGAAFQVFESVVLMQ